MKRTAHAATIAGLLLAASCATIDDLAEDIGIDDVGKAPETRATLIGAPKLGRCHQGSCTWYRVDDLAMIREAEGETLYRAQVRWGDSSRPDGDPMEADPRRVAIRWQPEVEETYVYCTARLPALIAVEEGAWRASRIDLVGTAGAMESAANLYASVCHPGEDRRGPAFARHHYRGIDDGEVFIPLTRPDDILNHGR